MILIVGLGNIGKEYEKTRHNFGFLAVDRLAKKYGFSPWKNEKKFFGDICTGQIENDKVVLIKPSTYMNVSGKAVQAIAHFYKITVQNIWIWHDDVDLPFGTIRIKQKGKSGGHNGLKSIMNMIGSQEFSRLKFGVKNDLLEKMPTDRFVLGNFSAEEWKEVETIIDKGITNFLTHESC